MAKISSIQALRGAAATMVAGFHLMAAAEVEGLDPGPFRIFAHGEAGVDIFFVISGFIIFYISSKRPGMTAGAFLEARFWRIYPPYWTILALYMLAAVMLALFFNDPSRIPDGRQLLYSIPLLPVPDQVIVITWTLAIEVLFYFVFALSYYRGGPRTFFATMVVWVILTQIFAHAVTDKPVWLTLPLHTAVLEFLFGALIALAFLTGRTRLHGLAFFLGTVWMLAFLGGYVDPFGQVFGREASAGLPSALLVYGAVGLTWDLGERLETWGESSYILYLIHIPYFLVIGRLVEVTTGFNVYSSQLAMLIMLITVVVLSYVATSRIEQPYQRWYARRFLARHKRPVTKAAEAGQGGPV